MKEHERWFRKAESDLLTITNNLSSDNVPADTCCFHAQQAAEKYLKAYLISRNISFPKTHDLQLLVNLIIPINPAFSEILSIAMSLIDYGVTSRYPDLLHEPELADAKKALTDANAIKQFVLTHFFE
jgi:HEPN domain-containing protein